MRSGALRIALIYIVVALAWITFSDRVLYIFHNSLSLSTYELINSGKGALFVLISGFFLYKLIRLDEKKLIATTRRSELASNEVRRLDNILTRVKNIVIITDKNNYICWVNKAFEDFTGYTFEEVGGYAPATFFAGEETDIDVLSAVIRSKALHEAFSAELNCHDKYGARFWVYGEYTPLFDESNNFNGYIAVYNDITGIKLKETETTRQNEKLREVAWLCSHEVRRPLANIIGLANLMKVAPLMEEKIRILDSINLSAEDLDKIVHTINYTVGTELENGTQPDPGFQPTNKSR